MFAKNLFSKNIQIIVGAVFLVIAIVLIIINPSTIINPITIDYDKKTFSGTLPVLLIIASVVFLWLGSKEKKDELADAKKALEETVNKINGRLVTLSFRFGPDERQELLKSSFKAKTLNGTYSLRNKGEILKNGKIDFYEDGQSKTIMAEFKDILFQDEHFIVFEIDDGVNKLQGSESLKIRIANLNNQ
ncbi:MAG: hypothetical protein JWQ09_6080 [Segetibacter sp.]|nr:hypothetical protein [Segetibacter sp.]